MEKTINRIWWDSDTLTGRLYVSWGYFLLENKTNPAKAKQIYEKAIDKKEQEAMNLIPKRKL